MKELKTKIVIAIDSHAKKINELIDDEKFAAAEKMALKALDLLPDQKTDYPQAMWLYSTLADIYFSLQEFAKSRDSLLQAVRCPGGLGNPFVHLRLGQSQFECGDMDGAADEFARAYAKDGAAIFEEEDPKYLEFLRSRMAATTLP